MWLHVVVAPAVVVSAPAVVVSPPAVVMAVPAVVVVDTGIVVAPDEKSFWENFGENHHMGRTVADRTVPR